MAPPPRASPFAAGGAERRCRRGRLPWSLPADLSPSTSPSPWISPCPTGIETVEIATAHGSGAGIGIAPESAELPGRAPGAARPSPRRAARVASGAWRRAASRTVPATRRPRPRAVSMAGTPGASDARAAPGASAGIMRGWRRSCASSAGNVSPQRDAADASSASAGAMPGTAASGPTAVPPAAVVHAVSWHPTVGPGASVARPSRPIGRRGRPTRARSTPGGGSGTRASTVRHLPRGPRVVPAAQSDPTCARARIADFLQVRQRSSSSRSRRASL